jgi:lipopolysaccharide biosynthesis glycosyltransferase
MKIAYAVTTGGRDIYSSMALISASTVRLSNPQAEIVVVCDQESFEKMKSVRDRLLDVADKVIPLEVAKGSAAMRSRFVKTSLGAVIERPFLFLDSDTVVRKDLSGIFNSTADVAAARNHSRSNLPEQLCGWDVETFEKMAWPGPTKDHLNSGVIFYAGNQACRAFAERWHRLWQQGCAAMGGHRDQAAFNHALRAAGLNWEVLPDHFNAQIKTRFMFKAESCDDRGRSMLEWDASIWHLYATQTIGIAETAFEELAFRNAQSQQMDQTDIEALVRSKHPWRRADLLDDLVAQLMRRQGKIGQWTMMWARGRRLGALKCCMLQLLRGTQAESPLPVLSE